MEIVTLQQFQSGSSLSLRGNDLFSPQFSSQKYQDTAQSTISADSSWVLKVQETEQDATSQQKSLNTYNNDGKSARSKAFGMPTETASLDMREKQLVIVFKDLEGKVTHTIPPTRNTNQFSNNNRLVSKDQSVDLYV